jgi:hypothetical protein
MGFSVFDFLDPTGTDPATSQANSMFGGMGGGGSGGSMFGGSAGSSGSGGMSSMFGGGSGGGMDMSSMMGGMGGGGGFMGNIMAGTGIGGSQSQAEKIYGTKPKEVTTPTLAEAQQKAISANIDSFDNAATLSSKTNRFNTDQIRSMLDATVPFRQALMDSGSSTLLNASRGILDPDVVNAIQRNAASRGIATGMSGSGANRNLELRDIGLTSQSQKQWAVPAIERWIGSARQDQTAQPFAIQNAFLSPAEQRVADMQKYSNDVYWNNIAAAPDPVARGQFDTQMALIGMALGVYSGGPGYQNSYKPNYGGQQNYYPGGSGGGFGGGNTVNYYGGSPDYSSNTMGGWESGGNNLGGEGALAFV